VTKPSTMPLSRLNTGDRGRVMALRGGREFQQRIVSLGLSMGCEVEVLQKGGGDNKDGPVVVRSGDTRLMVGHGMADKIVVRPI
jgi:Fe2+ transport system protein FeoA